jgi:hypothetical protein
MLKQDPERRQARADERVAREKEKEAARQAQAAANAEADFRASPQGRARSARAAGAQLFQISIPLTETQRTASSMMTGAVDTKRRLGGNHATVLDAIESEGWRLEHASYVFEQTGAVSRDKFMSSGQVTQATGRILGIYVFRALAKQPGGEVQADG